MEILHSLKSEFSNYSISAILFRVIGLLIMLIAMNRLGPEQYGVWVLLSPIITYSLLFSLGAPNAMNRLVPIYNGQGRHDESSKLQEVTLFIMTLAILPISLFIFLVFPIIWENLSLYVAFSFALLLIFENVYQYQVITHRSEDRFAPLASMNYLHSGVFLVVVGLGVWYGGLFGFIVSQFICLFVVVIALQKIGISRLKLSVDLKIITKLIKEGMPIALVSLLGGLLMVTDRYVIGYFLDTETTGVYGVGILAFSGVLLIPTLLSQYYYPKIAKLYGSNEKKALTSLYYQHYRQNGLVTIFVVIAASLIMTVLVEYFLEEYARGSTAMRINIAVSCVAALSMPKANILLVAGLHKERIAIVITTLLINIVLSIMSLKLGFGINGVAYSSLISNLIMFAMIELYYVRFQRVYCNI